MNCLIINFQKIFFSVLFLFTGISCEDNPTNIPESPQGNFTTCDLKITNLLLGDPNTTNKYRMITFDIEWSNSWRSSGTPNNWDAAWVFIKYKIGNGEWKHATLSTIASEHGAPKGSTINAPSDGKGIFLYRSENGTGVFKVSGVSLKWNYGLDKAADDATISIKAFGIEMVYIPEGSFYAGDNGQSFACLTKGSNDKRPWFITSENAIEVTNATTDGYYYTSSKDFWNDRFNASEDITGTSFTIPTDFPKGYRAIYCMKYEMTQEQYADFLNTLTNAQALNRYSNANYNKFGYTIQEINGVYSTIHHKRACGFINPSDACAYADWAGIRPMSELEFEKICRGSSNPPLNNEYAWGTTYAKNITGVIGAESDREILTTNKSNCHFQIENNNSQFPLNAGIFAETGKSREMSGATFYGVLEMSGNINETCISIGNSYGRAFTYRNGNGQLSNDGFSDESNWPQRDGKGAGYKGGNFARENHEMRISERNDATVEIDYLHRHIPLGFRGVRTVSY